MNKLKHLILGSLLLLTGCNSNTNNENNQTNTDISNGNNTNNTTNTVPDKYSDTELENLKKEYGEFSISREDGGNVNYTYNKELDEYRIKVESVKAKYVISGYTESHFIITNTDNLTSFKGIKLKLDKACIVSKNSHAPIYYDIESKNVEITAKKDTSSKIITLNGASGIDSENNIEIGGNGNLEIYTKTTSSSGSGGHCIKSSNKVTLYGTVNLNLTSAHDGIHCDDFLTTAEDNTIYEGNANFTSIASQAIEATTKRCNGEITLSGGKFTIDKSVNVFKVDKNLTISSGVEVKATNIKEKPIIKQTKDEIDSNVTIPVLDIVVNGLFTSNGTKIESQQI